MSVAEYRKQLSLNKETIEKLLYEENVSYPNLRKELSLYGMSLGNKLLQLLKYFISYGTDNEKQKISEQHIRGIEMYVSLSKLERMYGGTKIRWHKNINTLLAYGLLTKYIIPLDIAYADKKFANQYFSPTNEQLYSAKVAIAKHVRPVTWYHVPAYTEKLLLEADRRASLFAKYGRNIDKNAVRDVLGMELANTIFDSGYDISDKTLEIRNALKDFLLTEIENNGFAYKEGIIASVFAEMNNTKEHDMFHMKQIITTERILAVWKAYKPLLYAEECLAEKRPTKADKALYGISENKFIIRRTQQRKQMN